MSIDIASWLADLGLSQYNEIFQAQGFDGQGLASLEDAELRELGITAMGHRKTILREAAKLVVDRETSAQFRQSEISTDARQVPSEGAEIPNVEPATFGLTDKPLKLFLSYGRDDHVLEVKALLQALRLRGHEVWFDEEQLATGLDWEQSIEKGLQWCDKVVLTMTPHSVRRPDGYCLNEIAKAMEQQKLIVPVLLVEVPNGAPTSICRIQYLDWRDAIPAAENADRFMHRLKRLCEAIEHDKLDFEGGQQRLQRHLQPLNYDGDIRLHVARFEGRSGLELRLRKWLNEPTAAQVLWLTGAPGLGKSAIAAWLAHRWAETGAMHFCQAGHLEKADPVRTVLSIAFQLSQHLDLYRVRLSNLELERESQKNDARTLFDTLLVGPLALQYPAPDKPCVVILDGLDEATRADGTNPLAELVAADWARLPRWLRLIVSSRPDAEVQQWLSGVQTLALSGNDTEQQADLLTYMERQLQAMGRPVGPEVLQRILQASEGAFHYAVLLLEEVRQGRCNPEDPVDLPAGMNQIYLQSFRRRFNDAAQYRLDCRPLLALMLASPEPVPLQVMGNAEGIDAFEVRERLLRLGSMVAIEQAEETHGPQWDTARPAHASLRSWLTGLDERRMPLAKDFAVLPTGKALAEQVLAFWDEAKIAESVDAEPHGYIARALWPVLQRAGNTLGMDRIAFDLSLFWENRKLQLAIAPGEHAVRVTNRQADERQASAEQLERAAECSGHLGDLHVAMGQSSAALGAYRASSASRERLAAQDPLNAGWQRDLGGSYNRIGGVLKSQGDLSGALEMFQKTLVIAERLAGQDPLNAGWQQDLSFAYNRIGGVLESQGDLSGALEMFQKDLVIAERLAAQDPSNADWQAELASSLYCSGGIYEQMGQFVDAASLWQRELEVRAGMAALSADPSEADGEIASCHNQLGSALEMMGDFKGAREAFSQYLMLSENVLDRDLGNSTKQRNVAVGQASMARTEIKLDNLERAKILYVKAAHTFQALRDAEDQGTEVDWAAVLALGAEIAKTADDSSTMVLLQNKLATFDLGSEEPVGRFQKRFMPLIRQHAGL